MNPAYRQFVANTSTVCKNLLQRDYAMLAQLNVLWFGEDANWDELITQGELDSDSMFAASGLTTAELADVEYALAQILTMINDHMPAFAKLSGLL